MPNHPHQSKRHDVLLEWTGRSFVVAFRDGFKLTTGAAYPGCTAVWIKGDGDRARREVIFASAGAPYTYHHDAERMTADFAALLGAKIVPSVDDAALSMWGIDELSWS